MTDPKKALGSVRTTPALDTALAPPQAANEHTATVPESVDPRPSVFEALAGVVRDLPAIGKGETHAQGFAYRGIEGIMKVARTVLGEHGIIVAPSVRDRQVETILVGQRQSPWRLVTIEVRFRFYGPRGDWLDAVTVGEGFDPGDKAASKAHTMAFKTALIQVLQIADGDDAEATDNPEPVQTPPPPTREEAKARREEEQRVAWAVAASEHGDAHVSAVKALVSCLDEIPEETRAAVKTHFLQMFGPPAQLPPDQLPAASKWVAMTVDAHVPPETSAP